MEHVSILVVDDDPILRDTLASMLTVRRYKVLTAGSGTEALAVLQRVKIDLAILDLSLPDIPGLDILCRIGADYPSTAAIILTGEATLESAIEAANQGAFSYLRKPCEPEQLVLQIRRAIEKRQMEQALRDSEARFRGLLESAPDGMLIVDETLTIIMVNKQFETLFGYDRSEVVGRKMAMLIPAHFDRHGEHPMEYLRNPTNRRMGRDSEVAALRKDGSEFPAEISLAPFTTPEGLIVTAAIRDISERKLSEARIRYQANYDELTGLANRNLLAERLEQALQYAKRHQREVALLYVDLDQFKFINDSLGHNLGDRVLKIVAERLTACVRPDDVVVRHGGDDFVIILSDLAKNKDTVIVAQKIQAAVSQPLDINSHDLNVTCSIGISIHPKDGNDLQMLMKNAELAMFRAKEHGRNTFRFFTDELHDRVVERMNMERCLRRALENNELMVHYQPQAELATGRLIGCEALLRWQSPELGMVSPARFIPLAEETGLIIPIGEWVLETACRQNRSWQNEGFPALTMAVNLSPRQFWHPGLIGVIAQALHDSGLEPHCLELEITEGMVMRDVEGALRMLRELKELGVQLAIDDFGTGYSNLSQLKNFPFDKLKMDISFVREITFDPGSAAVARTIIAMAHNLDLRVISEGVETAAQLCYLRDHGCDEMQGYYFSRPLLAQDYARLLRERRGLSLPETGAVQAEKVVLLVDDEKLLLRTIERMLDEDGYRVLTTTSPNEGFELLATNRVGVLVSDLRMPEMNGSEFLSKVRRLYPETVRIAMSAYDDMTMLTETVNQGAVYKFLIKPIQYKVLRQVVASAFEVFESAAGRN